jgi:deoxyribose-phosphate aldolase
MHKLSSYIDHTLLKADADFESIKKLAQEANDHQFKAICIPPFYVNKMREFLNEHVLICSVAGFPLGYQTLESKLFEIQNIIQDGAEEVDVVINISQLKSGTWAYIDEEIKEVADLIHSAQKTSKLIIETAYLNETDILKLADLCIKHHIDFIKTSTGFAPKGATLEHINLIKNHVGDKLKIKASGGIKDKQTALDFINAGVDRIGTSSGVVIVG